MLPIAAMHLMNVDLLSTFEAGSRQGAARTEDERTTPASVVATHIG
jgi:hypothetical protein